MRKLLLACLLIAAPCFAQTSARFDLPVLTTTPATTPPGNQPPLYAVINATVNVCGYPATMNGGVCTNKVTTYTDSTLTTACPSTAQLTAPGSSACISTTGLQGALGFWYDSSVQTHMTYTISTAWGNFGPYDIDQSGGANLQVSTNSTPNASQSTLNFSNTTPAAPAGYTNVLWQNSDGNESAYVPPTSPTVSGECFLGIGGLVGAFTDSSGVIKQALCIGGGPVSLIVPSGATQLQLGVIDDDYQGTPNTGSFTISVSKNGGTASNVTVAATAGPWNTTTNPSYPYSINDYTSPTVVTGLVAGDTVTLTYVSGTVNVGGGVPCSSIGPNGCLTNPPGAAGKGGPTDSILSPTSTWWPTKYMTSAYATGTANAITALTGDVAASGPGSAASTLATVNSSPGTCGDSTHVCQITTDAKGRTTSQTTVAISGGGSGVSSINGNTGAMTFTGSGVSQSGNTFTFSGGVGATVDILSSQKDSGTLFRYPGLEYYSAASGVPVVIFTATGSGYISNIFFATANAYAFQTSIIACSVNGEASPSFMGTVRTLFENAWFNTGFEANAFTSINGTNYGEAFSMPIPYSNGITCTLTPSAAATIWVDVTAHSGVSDSWPYTRKLHTSIIESPTPANQNGVTYTPYSYETLVNYAGANPGRLVGLWLLDDESGGGSGAAMEGNIALYTDAFNATWDANTAFSVGQIIMDPNGNFQTVSTAGTTGGTEPTFTSATVSGQTTTDGTVTWTASVGTPLNIWRASAAYILGMSFLDPNGNVQTVTAAGTTSATQPTYCATAGCTTTDGTVTTTTSLAATMVKAAFVSTGTEDFFNIGFYGSGTGQNDQAGQGMWGMTFNANNRRGFYRFFLNDPIRFNGSIGIIRQIGDPSEVSLSVNTFQMAATYFYTQDTN